MIADPIEEKNPEIFPEILVKKLAIADPIFEKKLDTFPGILAKKLITELNPFFNPVSILLME